MNKYLVLALCLLVACGDKDSDSGEQGDSGEQSDTAAE